ncbi:MAG: hypothetical protein AB7F36_01120 [Reyranellaceae bacterium]
MARSFRFFLSLAPAALVTAAAVASAGAQQLPSWQPGSEAAEQSSFPYVYKVNPGGEPEIWRTNVVPLWPNEVCFGWTVAVDGPDRMADLTEVLTLSSPSTNWGHGPETVVENGNKATTKLRVLIEGSTLSRAWCIVAGDPPGRYSYDIYIDGRHRAQFTYCAVEVPNDGSVRIEELTCPYRFESVRDGRPAAIGEAFAVAYNALATDPAMMRKR